jgi:hypothetical protein
MLGVWSRRRAAVAPTAVARYQRDARVTAAVQGTQTVLTDGARFFTLNDSGSRVWRLLKEPCTSDEIVQAIAAEYDAPLDAIQRDTEQLLRELSRLKLVRTGVRPQALG